MRTWPPAQRPLRTRHRHRVAAAAQHSARVASICHIQVVLHKQRHHSGAPRLHGQLWLQRRRVLSSRLALALQAAHVTTSRCETRGGEKETAEGNLSTRLALHHLCEDIQIALPWSAAMPLGHTAHH